MAIGFNNENFRQKINKDIESINFVKSNVDSFFKIVSSVTNQVIIIPLQIIILHIPHYNPVKVWANAMLSVGSPESLIAR